MVVVPAETPDTTPLSEPIVATEVLLLQRPPATTSPNVTDDPAHTVVGPVIGLGVVLTVSVVIVLHPVGNV